jgi:hypothetical protein
MSCILVVIRLSKGNQTKITGLPQIIQKTIILIETIIHICKKKTQKKTLENTEVAI